MHVLALYRAALSISANVPEGNGRFAKADRRNFFGIARSSAQECVLLLKLASRRGHPPVEEHASLKAQLEEIARMLAGLINGLDNCCHLSPSKLSNEIILSLRSP